MNRIGGISESISLLSKMSFETASHWNSNAWEVDNLEAWGGRYHLQVKCLSARACLGLPVKMGTGSFDLMHKLEIWSPL
jgi:DNA-directed RNA polymerase I subunit RPA1